MFSLKGVLSIVVLAVLIQPSWAANGDATVNSANGTVASPPRQAAPAPATPGARTCAKAARPALSNEERARRKAVRAERAALGIQPAKKTPAQIAARRARTNC
jgi:hypothetical protein